MISMPHHPSFAVRVASIAAIALGAPGAAAQPGAPQIQSALPPIRSIGKAHAASTELLGAVSQARALPDGRVLVNDNLGRKVVLFSKDLSSFTVVADTTSATANAYSSRAGGLIAYRGDSTLFVDPQSLSMLVIDGKGQVTRVMSVPRPNEATALIGGPNGTPGFDAEGRLVYRGFGGVRMMGGRGAGAPGTPGAFATPQFPESVTVVRINLETRVVDTVAHVKIPKQNVTISQGADGRMSVSTVLNPLQYVDDWTVTSDGRVAVVRGQEYRVDWIGADGKVASTQKIPFSWRRLDDSTKTAFLDSTRTAMEKLREQAQAVMQRGGGAGAAELQAMAAAAGVAGGAPVMAERMVVAMGRGADMPAIGTAANAPARGTAGAAVTLPPLQFVPISELPDYAPPFSAGAVRGDADGNIWIRTSNVLNGGSVYDVVNGKGQLTDRVLLPPGRVIAGFGPGTVYMGYRDGPGVRLEAAQVRDASIARP
jgi:hypothetical protein